MTTVTGDRVPLRRRKKGATRARNVKVAVPMFGERRFERPIVEQIAAAELGKGTVHNYFGTKEVILVPFTAEVEKRVQARARHFPRVEGHWRKSWSASSDTVFG